MLIILCRVVGFLLTVIAICLFDENFYTFFSVFTFNFHLFHLSVRNAFNQQQTL